VSVTPASSAAVPPAASAPALLGTDPTVVTGPSGTAVPPAGTTGVVVVDVQGAVRRPGVVELPVGSRVVDALAAAGGTTRHAVTLTLNLAQVLVDGTQVLVPDRRSTAAPASAAGSTAAPTGAAPGTPVDLNTATLEQLDGLPGIGPVLAQRILDWRTEHGRFTSVEELGEVSGIGDKMLSQLRSKVTV
jgi:competence protein ComEA